MSSICSGDSLLLDLEVPTLLEVLSFLAMVVVCCCTAQVLLK